MYLDLIRLYTATAEPEKAAALLTEFEAKFASEDQNSKEFPRLALKLADAFANAEKYDESRRLMRQAMDFIGSKTAPGKLFPKIEAADSPNNSKPDFDPSATFKKSDLPATNLGINIPQKKKPDDYYYEKPANFRDFLSDDDRDEISYPNILARYLDSLRREIGDSEILAFYTAEIAKYPNEEGLYEQFLNWLETAKLTEKQLEVYRQATKTFNTKSWQDRLARWFLAQKRESEFLEFSHQILENADDERTRNFLAEFIAPHLSQSDSIQFDADLFLGF